MRAAVGRDRGMVTAELAAALPVLVLVLAVALSAVAVVGARVRLQDAAREAARASARGDPGVGRSLARAAAPGATITVARSGDAVAAVATEQLHPLGDLLPTLTVSERAVAAVEPQGSSP